MRQVVHRFMRDESGVTAIEYGLIAAGIAVVIIAAVNYAGSSVRDTFNTVATDLANNNAAAA